VLFVVVLQVHPPLVVLIFVLVGVIVIVDLVTKVIPPPTVAWREVSTALEEEPGLRFSALQLSRFGQLWRGGEVYGVLSRCVEVRGEEMSTDDRREGGSALRTVRWLNGKRSQDTEIASRGWRSADVWLMRR
jgi:hypothetical protein